MRAYEKLVMQMQVVDVSHLNALSWIAVMEDVIECPVSRRDLVS